MHDLIPPAAAPTLRERNVSGKPSHVEDAWQAACTRDPERWTTTADEGAKALCRVCPLRWRCAQDACSTPGAEGVWAGILIPESGRGRRFALKQLRSLAEDHGYPVRKTG